MIRVLMPDSHRWPVLEARVAKRLGQGDRHALRADAWLSETFGAGRDGEWPAAALTRTIDSADLDEKADAWLRADPAWIKADINGGKLLGVGETLPMSPADVIAFLPTLQPLFGDAGMPLDAPNPHRWYLKVKAGMPLPKFSAPATALGDDAFEHLNFEGPHRRWKTLMSEAQILLHQHPRNEVRASEGLPPINSLWFWGQGALPPKREIKLSKVFTRDAMLAGIAQHQGLDAVELLALPKNLTEGDLYDLRSFPANEIASSFLPEVMDTHIQFLFEDIDSLELKSGQGIRFWRKPLQWPVST